MIGQRDKARDADAKSSVRNSLSAVMPLRDESAGDWSNYATSLLLRNALAAEEGSFTFVTATADGLPVSTGPKNVVVRRVDADNVTLSARSASDTYFCIQAVSDGPAVFAKDTVAATCDGGTGGW